MMLNEVTDSKFKNAFNGILCKLNIEKVVVRSIGNICEQSLIKLGFGQKWI